MDSLVDILNAMYRELEKGQPVQPALVKDWYDALGAISARLWQHSAHVQKVKSLAINLDELQE